MKRKIALKKKRRIQGKTNYNRRLELIASAKPRLVIRKSLKNIIIQLIKYEPNGDKVLVSAHTNELKRDYNLKAAKRNTPAAYLVGLLLGKKALQKGIKEAVLDLGLYKPIKNSILYAALKGALDSGLSIPHSKEIFPSESRIKGEHLKNMNFEEVKSNILKK